MLAPAGHAQAYRQRWNVLPLTSRPCLYMFTVIHKWDFAKNSTWQIILLLTFVFPRDIQCWPFCIDSYQISISAPHCLNINWSFQSFTPYRHIGPTLTENEMSMQRTVNLLKFLLYPSGRKHLRQIVSVISSANSIKGGHKTNCTCFSRKGEHQKQKYTPKEATVPWKVDTVLADEILNLAL